MTIPGFVCLLVQTQTLAPGAPAPDFNLPGVDGKGHSLKDFATAKVLVVLFTCNHCPTAQRYEERVKKFVSEYKDKGVALVAISPNDPQALRLDELGYTDVSDSFEEMKIRAKNRQYNFDYLYDGETQAVSRQYGPAATPHVFVFDAERKLQYTGRIDSNENEEKVTSQDLRAAVDALLAGKPVETPKTRAFGCSTKWSDKRDSAKKFMDKLAGEKVIVEPAEAEALAALRKPDNGKLRLINVWATWCGPCVAEFPELITIYRMYRHRNFELVTVAAQESDKQDEVFAFLQKQQASCRNLMLGKGNRDQLFDAIDKGWSGAIPLTLLVSPAGEVLYKREGQINELELRRVIVKNLRAK